MPSETFQPLRFPARTMTSYSCVQANASELRRIFPRAVQCPTRPDLAVARRDKNDGLIKCLSSSNAALRCAQCFKSLQARIFPNSFRAVNRAATESACTVEAIAASEPYSIACALRSSNSQNASAPSWVASSTTFGAKPASNASCQRGAHKHHRSPACSPGNPH